MRTTAAALALMTWASAAPAQPQPAPSLLDTIALWLTANFDLPPTGTLPSLAKAPDELLARMRYGPAAEDHGGTVSALYDAGSGTILVSDGWTGRTAADTSILVHEMVHHLQAMGELTFACPAEREVLAYRAQDAWLTLFGESLEITFGLDPALLLVSTVCTH